MRRGRAIALGVAVLLAAGVVPAVGGAAAAAATTTTYLSDLTPTAVKNGLGPMERDRHNGGAAAGDGGPIVLNGRRYTKGLGTNAFAQVSYALGYVAYILIGAVMLRSRVFGKTTGYLGNRHRRGRVRFLPAGGRLARVGLRGAVDWGVECPGRAQAVPARAGRT